MLFNEVNMFHNIERNTMFFAVSLFTVGCQVILVEFGGEFMRTSSLDLRLWLISILIGSVTLLVGFLTRLCLPIEEDPNAYFDVALTAEEEAANDGGVITADKAGHIKPKATPTTGSASPMKSPKVAPV